MGVGKTTLGLKLANKLGYYFIDSDQEIEDRQKRSIKEIFETDGEPYFRQIEKEVIKEVVLRGENIVLSLGGGAFMNDEVRQYLQKDAMIIWLDADIDHILHRVGYKDNRPLLNQVDKRKVLQDLMQKRYPIYAQADFKFDTGVLSQEAVVTKIIKEIKNYDK